MEEKNLFEEDIGSEEFEEVVEYKPEDLSDKPLGEKYERADLNGKEIIIKDARLFSATTEDPIQYSRDGKTKYKSARLTIYFDTPNNDRESLSGVKQFVNADGTLATPTIYPEGKNQASKLWKLVAAKLDKEPKDLSMQSFLKFLKNKPKARIKKEVYEFDDKVVEKNMVSEFL